MPSGQRSKRRGQYLVATSKSASQLLLVPTLSLVDQLRLLSDFERAQLGLYDLTIFQASSTMWWEFFEVMLQQDSLEPTTIGFAAVSKEHATQSATLQGFFIQKDYRRKGIGKAVLEAVMSKVFVAWGMRRFGTQALGIAESHTLFKTILIKEGTLREVSTWKGTPVDLVQYSLLRREYVQRYPESFK